MIGVKSEWRATLTAKDGTVKQSVGWHKNAITNAGLNAFWSTGVFIEKFDTIAVGSGTGAPAYTDTALDDEVDATGVESVDVSDVNDGAVYAEFSATFGLGEAVGSLTEVCLRNDSVMWCRNLFTDNGSPVVIEKGTTDTLTVVVRVTISASTTYTSGTSPNHKVCILASGLTKLLTESIYQLTPGKCGTSGTVPSMEDTGIRGEQYGSACYDPATFSTPVAGEISVTFDVPALYWAGVGYWREWVPTDENGHVTAGSFRWVADGNQTKDNTQSYRFVMKYKLERV